MDTMTDEPNPDIPAGEPVDAVVRALRAAVSSVEAAVARMSSGAVGTGSNPAGSSAVEQVLELADAPGLGDVVAHHNALTRAVAIVDQAGALPTREWEAIADLGAPLATAVTRLRSRASVVLDSADAAEPGALDPGQRLGETLQLLVLVEDSLYLWHRLRLDNLRTDDPGALPGAIAEARGLLAEHFGHDGELLRRARRALARSAEGTAFELVRRLSSTRTVKGMLELRQDLDDFRGACRADAAGWLDDEDPAIAEALDEISSPVRIVGGALGVAIGGSAKAFGDRAAGVGASGVERIGRGIAKVGEARHRHDADADADVPSADIPGAAAPNETT